MSRRLESNAFDVSNDSAFDNERQVGFSLLIKLPPLKLSVGAFVKSHGEPENHDLLHD